MMTRIAVVWLMVCTLAACAIPAVEDESLHGFRMPVGSTLVLHEQLAVPQGHARVFLQNGKVVKKTKLESYQPHCAFEQRMVSDGNSVIAPDRFTVTAVSAGEDYVVQRGGLLHASWRIAGADDSPSMVNRYIHHSLSSASQPQVMRLTCHGGFDFPGRAELPTLSEIRKALGALASVELL